MPDRFIKEEGSECSIAAVECVLPFYYMFITESLFAFCHIFIKLYIYHSFSAILIMFSFLPFGFLLVVIILKSKKIYKTPNSCITSFVTRLFLLFQNLLCTSLSLSEEEEEWPTEDIDI